MGNGCKPSKTKGTSVITGDMVLPEFLEEKYFAISQGQEFTFDCKLHNIQIRNLAFKTSKVKLKFNFGDEVEVETKLHEYEPIINIDIVQKFKLQMNREELQKKYLVLEIQDSES